MPTDNDHTCDLPTPDDIEATRVKPTGAAPAGALAIPGYDLMPEIARGGMGVVYAARDLAFDREVAVKVMLPGMNAAEFVREARITGRLPHPGIPPVHALGELPDGRPFLAMKLIRGDTLDKVLKARADLSAGRGRLLAAFEQMCQAVGYAHAQGIVHRDLKPSNVMVGAFGEVQVMDWGLAKELSTEDTSVAATRSGACTSDTESVAGQIKGTPAYMAPEQARGEPVDARADVFALGGILAAILTGKPPFAGNSVMDTIIRASQADLGDTFARLDNCGADADLLALAKRCLAARPDDRPADGTELATAVAVYRAEVEERLRRAERERAAAEAKAEEQRKRRRMQWALTTAVALLAVAGAAGAVIASLWLTAEANRAEAVTQKDAADAAKDDALTQKGIAEEARKAVEREREALRLSDYGGGTRLAHAEWRAGNAGAMRDLLDKTDPKLRGWEWRYLDRLYHGALLDLSHEGAVYSAAFSPDGTRVVTASHNGVLDGKVRVWDAKSGAVLMTLDHKGVARSAAFSPDGTRILTTQDSTAKVWDAKTGNEVLAMKGTDSTVLAVAFCTNGTRVLTVKADNTAGVWDPKTRTEESVLSDTGFLRAAAFSPNGNRVVTADWIGGSRVWDLEVGGKPLTFNWKRRIDRTVRSLAFSPDGARVVAAGVTADSDGFVQVWDALTGTELVSLKHPQEVHSAAFSPDGARIVTADAAGTVRVWNSQGGDEEEMIFKGHAGDVHSAAFSRDGAYIVTAGADGTARLWDARTEIEGQTLEGAWGVVHRAGFSRDGTRVVAVGADGTARLWDARTGAEGQASQGHVDEMLSAESSPDGTRVVATRGTTVRVCDARTGVEVLTLRHEDTVSSAAFSPDGARILTVDSRGRVRVWDARTRVEWLADPPPPPPVAPLPREVPLRRLRP